MEPSDQYVAQTIKNCGFSCAFSTGISISRVAADRGMVAIYSV